MTTRIAVGYIRVHLPMTPEELADIEERLAQLAKRHGYHLEAVFTERPESTPAAFIELITAVNRYDADAVVLPSVMHLAVLGLPPQVIHHLEATTGTKVLVADDPAACG
jgi:hypothetical protein